MSETRKQETIYLLTQGTEILLAKNYPISRYYTLYHNMTKAKEHQKLPI